MLLDANLTVIHDSVFAAEDDGRLRSRRVLNGRVLAAGEGLTRPASQALTMDHVEAHAAAVLRRREVPGTASLVVNNLPCEGDETQPLLCDRLLPEILPPTMSLTVYVTDGTRTWLHGTYTGTGERIAS